MGVIGRCGIGGHFGVDKVREECESALNVFGEVGFFQFEVFVSESVGGGWCGVGCGGCGGAVGGGAVFGGFEEVSGGAVVEVGVVMVVSCCYFLCQLMITCNLVL